MTAVTKRWTVYCVCATMFASAGGCATNSDTIALERQLRRKESQVHIRYAIGERLEGLFHRHTKVLLFKTLLELATNRVIHF